MSTHDLLEKRLENIRMSPELCARVRTRTRRGRAPLRARLIPILALTAVLLLMAGVAFAYSQGLFGTMAARTGGSIEAQLDSLNENASVIGATQVIPASDAYGETTVDIAQAYYDGQSLYIAYCITFAGQQADADTESKDSAWITPPEGLDGFERFYDSAHESGLFSDEECARIDAALARGERVCLQMISQGLSDTPKTADGEDVPPLTGGSIMENGVYSAWTKFESPLPEAMCGLDALSLCYDFTRVTTTVLITDEGVYMRWDREKSLPIAFTVPRTTQTHTLSAGENRIARDAQGNETPYAIEATLRCSNVSIEATVTLTGVPDAWLAAIESDAIWETPAAWHPPVSFSLYAGDECIAPTDGSIHIDAQTHTVTFQFATVPCSADTYRLQACYGDESRDGSDILLFRADTP